MEKALKLLRNFKKPFFLEKDFSRIIGQSTYQTLFLCVALIKRDKKILKILIMKLKKFKDWAH